MFVAVTLLAVACAERSVSKKNDSTLVAQQTDATPTTTANTPATLPAETASTIPHLNAKNSGGPLTCGPRTFGPGDTVTLRMRTPHGHYLWITKSDRTAYLVVYPPQGELKAEYSLVPSDEFARVETIRLPSQIEAIPYVYGRDTVRERVFSEPGKYLLEVGDNFATDGGSPAPSCNLTYVQKGSK
jgi:hypothetical protein